MRLRFVLVIAVLILCISQTVHAEQTSIDKEADGETQDGVLESSEQETQDYLSYLNDFNYDTVQEAIDDALSTNESFDFKEYVSTLATSGKGVSDAGLFSDILQAIGNELKGNRDALLRLILIAIMAAVFTNFTSVFQNNQVGETSFYITYLLLFGTITGTFASATIIATQTIQAVIDFMKALLPTYFMSIAFCSSKATTLVFYESTLMLITVVNLILVHIMIPLVNIYLVITLVNNLAKEDLLSKFAELIETVITWSLRTLFVAVIGFNAIQGLIVPTSNSIKRTVATRLTKAIPGIGNSLNSVTETVLGAGTLIKNAIGVAGLVVVVIICMLPLVKLFVTMFLYKFGVAIVQPISDKRVINCISGAANAAGMLIYVVSISAVLFMITIAILAASTSIRIV